jgi:hypothetical protein
MVYGLLFTGEENGDLFGDYGKNEYFCKPIEKLR